MKIAFILPSLANRGPIIMVSSLVEYLVQQGHQCTIYYFDELEAIQFKCPTKRIRFLEPIDFGAYQIIHSHLFRPDVYCLLHLSKIKKAGVKTVSTIHTAIYDDLSFTYGKILSSFLVPVWKAAWKVLDHAVLLTATAQQYYQGTIFKAVSVINNGVTLPAISTPIDVSDLQLISQLKSYTLLGTVCAIDQRKGLEQVFALLKEMPHYAFLIVGDGKGRFELERAAARLGLSERFKILGFRENGYRYMPYFDLYLLPSRSEGMPMALLEAIAQRVPVVCARIPVFTAEFSSKEVSFFDLDSKNSMIDACNIALSAFKSPDIAFRHYELAYTAAKMGDKYTSLYHSLRKNPIFTSNSVI